MGIDLKIVFLSCEYVFDIFCFEFFWEGNFFLCLVIVMSEDIVFGLDFLVM